MKYKVGDKVRIKVLDEIKRKNPHLGYNDAMIQIVIKLIGQIYMSTLINVSRQKKINQ